MQAVQSLKNAKKCDQKADTVVVSENERLSWAPVEDFVELSGTIEKDTNLAPGFYKVTEEDLHVACGATLFIEPGAVLEFGLDKKLVIHGHLDIANVDHTAVFFRGHLGRRWGGIEIYSEFWEPRATAIFRHVVIEKAEAAINVGPRASVLIEENSVIRRNKKVSHYILGHLAVHESEIVHNEEGWRVQSIGKNPQDESRVGHLELSHNIIRETHIPFYTEGFGRLTLRDNFQFDMI